MATLLNKASCGADVANTGSQGYCKTSLTGARKIFLTTSNFSFSTIADAMNKTKWVDGIKNKSIIPFPLADNVTAADVEPKKSSNDYTGERVVKDGHNGFTLSFEQPILMLNMIRKFNHFTGRAFVADENGNIIGYTPDGVKVQGLTLDELFTGFLKEGTATTFRDFETNVRFKYTSELADHGVSFNPDWDPYYLEGIENVVLELVGPATTSGFTFTVSFRGKDYGISGLLKTNVVLKNSTGVTQSITTLTDNGNGEYVLAATLIAGSYTLDLVGITAVDDLVMESISADGTNPGPLAITISA